MGNIFSKFKPFSGIVEPGYSVDFLGVKTKNLYFSGNHIESCMGNYPIPEFNEEYFEWIDVLESVFLANSSYTMIELGAGWGRWLSRAHAALRQIKPYILSTLVGVEAEPTHFKWMQEHCKYNNISATLINAAVNDVDGKVGFHTGNPAEWYGQCIGGETTVNSISLKCIMDMFDSIDLIDLDVQNYEFKILNSVKPYLHKVKRFHIGTHSKKVEHDLRKLFDGWLCVNDYSLFTTHKTIHGEAAFNDGVQTWINPDNVNDYNRLVISS